MGALVLSLLLAALLLAARMPDSNAVIVVQNGAQNGPSICPGPCRCGVMNSAPQQRVARDPEGEEEGEDGGEDGGALSRQRRFASEGTRVPTNLYPWLAAVTRLPPYSGFHAAALISDRHVLTAASVVSGVPWRSLRVTLGVGAMCGLPDRTAINVSVENVQLLPSGYLGEVDGGDGLALLQLVNAVRFSNTLRPVCLPPNDRSTYVGRTALAVGFGANATEPSVAANVSAADNSSDTGFTRRCRPRSLQLPVASCAGGGADGGGGLAPGCLGSAGMQQVACPSDTGSLVQVRGARGEVQLIGVVSNTNNCTAGEMGPAQFILTAQNLRWLLRNTAGSCFCAAP